jgi:hypothetical protein
MATVPSSPTLDRGARAARIGAALFAIACGPPPHDAKVDDGSNAPDSAMTSAPDDSGTAGASIPTPSAGSDAESDAGASLAEATTASVMTDGGFALYDDFEVTAVGGPPSPALWTISQPDCTGTGMLAVDDSQAHSGKHSVRVNGGSGYCDHIFFANASAITSLGSEVYARFFLRLDAPLGAGHVTFLAMKDTADKGDDVRMGGQDSVLMYNRQSDDATLPVLSPTGVASSMAPMQGKWTCIEFHFDESAGTIDTWVDSEEVKGLVENGTPVPDESTQWLSRAGWKPMLADFRLGWESYSGQTMTLWFDDVALSRSRIGCGS